MWQEAGGAIGLSCPGLLCRGRPGELKKDTEACTVERCEDVRPSAAAGWVAGRFKAEDGGLRRTNLSSGPGGRSAGSNLFIWWPDAAGYSASAVSTCRRTLGFFSLTFADYFLGVFVRTSFPRGIKNVAFTVRTVKGGRVKLILTEGHISIIVALEVVRLN